jgi:hypothetical protein
MMQGDLSNLCGLYSPINAIQLALHPGKRLSQPQLQRIFRHGVEYLIQKEQLVHTLEHGLTVSPWLDLARKLAKYAAAEHGKYLVLRPILRGLPRYDREAAFEAIGRHLLAGHPILLGIWGTYSHFSVLVGLSARKLTLFDSGGFRWLRRDCVSFMHDGTRNRHRIARHSVFALVPRDQTAAKLRMRE